MHAQLLPCMIFNTVEINSAMPQELEVDSASSLSLDLIFCGAARLAHRMLTWIAGILVPALPRDTELPSPSATTKYSAEVAKSKHGRVHREDRRQL
jgi:hypothetical protein